MNEINKLIWPNDKGIGVMDAAAFQQTADIALKYKVISKAPDAAAYRTDLAQKALTSLGSNFDPYGKSFTPLIVVVGAGGGTATVNGAPVATMAATLSAGPGASATMNATMAPTASS